MGPYWDTTRLRRSCRRFRGTLRRRDGTLRQAYCRLLINECHTSNGPDPAKGQARPAPPPKMTQELRNYQPNLTSEGTAVKDRQPAVNHGRRHLLATD